MDGRALPQALEAERAVLGGLLLAPEQLAEVAELLGPEDWYREAHRVVWELLQELAEAGQARDLVGLVEALRRRGLEERAGGLSYVAALSDTIPATISLLHYAELVRDSALRRRLVLALGQLRERVLAGDEELPELLGAGEDLLRGLTDRAVTTDVRPLEAVMDDVYRRTRDLAAHPDRVTGTPTGYLELDRLMAGLQPTDLVVLAGRPAMGKSALAMSVAQNAAGRGHGVLVCSLEMGAEQLGQRAWSGEARVPLGRIRTGRLGDVDWHRLSDAHGTLAGLPLWIDDTPALTVAQIRGRARRLKARAPALAVIVVDYIQLMGADARLPREQQVSAASRGLKALAKELNVTVVGLSQLNRGVEQRADKRPLLSDLRESGAIEQDADVIMFVYRDEYYNKESADRNIAEVIVAKQRNGPTGTARLFFEGEFTRFENLDETAGGWTR